MSPNHCLPLLFVLLSFVWCHSKGSTLLSVVQVFRHGARTPVLFYPTDPYQDKKYWNGLGPGELTDLGKIQLRNLGTFFRKRYDGFVPETYSENDILIKSDDTHRNIQSAKSFVEGLYPSLNHNISIELSDWSVMGIMLDCPKFAFYYELTQRTDEYFREVNKRNRKLYRYVRQNSKSPAVDLYSTFLVWDPLNIESMANLSLPKWTQKVFPEALGQVSNDMALSMCYTEKLQILGAGRFLDELINHFETILLNSSAEPKTVLYSGHDINIACFLNTFGMYQIIKPTDPPFASSLIFELRKTEYNDEYFINGYYKPEEELIPIEFKYCGFNCEIGKFKDIFENIVIDKIKWLWKCFSPAINDM